MAVKRTPGKAGRTKKRKKTTSKKGGRNWPLTLALLLGLALLAAWGGYFVHGKFKQPKGNFQDALESMLLSADIELDRNVRIKFWDGVETWRIEVPDLPTEQALIKAIDRWVDKQGGKRVENEEKRIKGVPHRLVTYELVGGRTYGFLFARADRQSKATPKQSKRTSPDHSLSQPKQKALPEQASPVAKGGVPEIPLDPPGSVDPAPAPGKSGQGPRIAIILDDIGQREVPSLDTVLNLNLPITFAVIPFLKFSNANANYLHRHHYEVMLHMPMEPHNYPVNNPGDGAILYHFTDKEVRGALDKALRDVPYVVGVNNHMGSRITANRSLMKTVLQDVKRRNLYFVDSRTHKSTVAYEVAKELNVPSAERHVFLDAEISLDFTKKQMEETARIAADQGFAIAIGHPHLSTQKALAEMMPRLDKEGFRFVFVSEVIQENIHF